MRAPSQKGSPLNALDPRAPLVVDLRELDRPAGSMRRFRRSVPAPTGLALATAWVPQGTDVDLDLRLESVVEGVLVSGTVHAQVAGECRRCLDQVADTVEVEVQELFVRPMDRAWVTSTRDGDEPPAIVDERLDLEPVLRDAIVLALPLAPLCQQDCPGLCPQCGTRLAESPGHTHDIEDSRFAALRSLTLPEHTQSAD